MTQQHSLSLDSGLAIVYRLRHSPQSRRARIKICPQGRVEVVVPLGFDLAQVPAFVAQHHQWIQDTQDRFKTTRQTLAPETLDRLPQSIELRAIGTTWYVSYNPYQATDSTSPTVTLRADAPHLLLQGSLQAVTPCCDLLGRWLRLQAKAVLPPLLQSLSQTTGLGYSQVTLRSQKTLWGSCSARQSISLNDRLLFLPPDLVRYVLIHELCHTRHLDHSPRFWALVSQKDPDYAQWEKALKQAWAYVPPWVNP
ncbi:M48 family metallopeptidase [Prochlorothrix hollandica]|uniref:YgjP-like metallopeptidase domain-containing protein n=1 Tax=Prochlorothrix hollandica PCC 9006 = CALU 1027 TaxID=317619 RepID=A0A0M2PZP4_PROHO|nr:SprT family zinc-dependent metalloprotease [Prochlorothrix hollandica]KKJ01635.1 hypothetical protein PROH_01295 [Prochlorothrix hollandica PCC 9006 = CALU 1027]